MKKFLIIMCTAMMLIALSACGSSGVNDQSETAAKSSGFEAHINHIQANAMYTYGLKPDGTIVASAEPFIDGGNVVKTLPEYRSWKGIKNFSSSSEAIAAVLEDGSVVMCGGLIDETAHCDFSPVAKWKDVVQVAMGKHDIVALKADGSVEIAGSQLTKQLKEIDGFVQVEAGCEPMGVKADGTVVVWNWSWQDPIDEVEKWTDIKAVSSTFNHIVALKSDGTVVACGNNDFGQCDVSEWKDIIAVSAGLEFTVGLKSDGTVVICGTAKDGLSDVTKWSNIVELDAGYYHCAGIQSDGTVVSVGGNYQGQCNTSGWKLK